VAQSASVSDPLADVRKAAEASVRVSAGNPELVRFRGVQVWPQALKNQFAVCGQAATFGAGSNTFVLFVALVTRDDVGTDQANRLRAEVRVGSTISEATRVYIETLARCFEGGGPQALKRETVPQLPPLPDDPKAVLAASTQSSQVAPVASPAVPPAPPPRIADAAAPASGTIVMRQAGNIRATPQGETLRIEPAGKELHVFGTAPGGWLQVGDIGPNGWVHSSLVQRR